MQESSNTCDLFFRSRFGIIMLMLRYGRTYGRVAGETLMSTTKNGQDKIWGKKGGHEKPITKTEKKGENGKSKTKMEKKGGDTKNRQRRHRSSAGRQRNVKIDERTQVHILNMPPPPRLHRRSGGNTGGHEQAQSQYRACRLTANKPPPDTRKYQKKGDRL